jgi:hypothetical protein
VTLTATLRLLASLRPSRVKHVSAFGRLDEICISSISYPTSLFRTLGRGAGASVAASGSQIGPN